MYCYKSRLNFILITTHTHIIKIPIFGTHFVGIDNLEHRDFVTDTNPLLTLLAYVVKSELLSPI